VAVVIVVGIVALGLFAVGFVSPPTSRRTQGKVGSGLGSTADTAVEVPGGVGTWLAKPFRNSRKAVDKSTRAGRKTRFKLPF
jgi:hypothetical protein